MNPPTHTHTPKKRDHLSREYDADAGVELHKCNRQPGRKRADWFDRLVVQRFGFFLDLQGERVTG